MNIFAAISCCYSGITCAFTSYDIKDMRRCILWMHSPVVLDAVAFLSALGTGLVVFCSLLRTFLSERNSGIMLSSAAVTAVFERRGISGAPGNSIGRVIALVVCGAFSSMTRCTESFFELMGSTTLQQSNKAAE